MSQFRGLALTLTCAVVLAACGGSALSAEEYRSQGNAACDRYEDDVQALPQPESIDDVPKYAGEAQQRLTKLVDELDALEPPSELSAQHDQLVALGRESVDEIAKLKVAGESKKQSEINAVLKSAGELDDRSDAVATELGLTQCAEE